MAVDLHTHSTASDGSDPPAAVVRGAARAGLRAIALTDHDTLEGIDEARSEASRQGVELIAGVELACEWEKGGLHLIVLFLEPLSGPLQDRLPELRAARDRRNRATCERLRGLGVEIDYPEVVAQAQGGSVGRPHFAALLVAKGYVEDLNSAFAKFLGRRGAAYVARPLLPPDQAIDLALRSGGVPVLAHPHTLGLDTAAEYTTAFEDLADAGLVGVECFYSGYAQEKQRRLEAAVRSLGLLPSGGSDYHGAYKPGLSVGVGSGDLVVPDRVLEDLRATRLA